MTSKDKYIEQEFVYMIDDIYENKNGQLTCKRDDKIFNRYWFEFPPEWRTASQRERLIGFRSFWISKTYRHLEFDLDIEYSTPEREVNNFTVHIHSRVEYENDLREVWYDIRNQVTQYIERYKTQWETDGLSIPDIAIFMMNYEYLEIDNRPSLCMTLYPSARMHDGEELLFRIRNLNHDAKIILNCLEPDTDFKDKLCFTDIWDRHSVLLCSSISINNSNNYLGYSHTRYTPIKYYRVNSAEPNFHIDIYNGHKHDIPINLPVDEREQIILEITTLDKL